VAVYRFLPIEDSGPLFQICFEAERSAPVKTSVVRACLTLAQDALRFHWQKPLDQPASWVARRCREILTVRTLFYLFCAPDFSCCRALAFAVSRLITWALPDGLHLDQKPSEILLNLFQREMCSFLPSFRSGGRLRHSSSKAFRLQRTLKVGQTLLSSYGSPLPTFQSKSRRPAVCGRYPSKSS
jgi:hypothetical protein